GEYRLQWADRQEQTQYGEQQPTGMNKVQPTCLLHRDEDFQAGTLCVASGWGKVSKGESNGREVELPLTDRQTCSVLLRGMNLPLVWGSMLCTGLPDGRGLHFGQGDSGGPLACLRAGGTWTLAIVVSWGVSCARGWDTLKRSITARGSPGIFSQVAAFMDFSAQHMTPGRYDYWEVFFLSCLFSTNRDPNCHAIAASHPSTSSLAPSGKACRDVFPLLAELDQAAVKFVSNGNNAGSGCESVAMLVEEGKIDTCDSFSGSLADTCGLPPVTPQGLFTRVSGAEEACPCCWPWHAALTLLGEYPCNAAAISPTWLLTATHCVQLSNKPLHWTVTAEDHDRALRESTEQVRQVKTIVVHPHLDMLSHDSNIALVQPVCLPNPTEIASSSSLCAMSRQLQQTQVPVLENEICERNYYFSHPGGITARMLCAGGSGGPFVCNTENGAFALYGIVSWGVGCGSPKKPGVYSRVWIFLYWIKLLMKGEFSLSDCTGKLLMQKLCLPDAHLSTERASEVELEEPRGFISAPSSSGYVGSTECSWILQLPLKGIAKIIVKHLSISSSLNCQEEFLEIYEESQRGRKVLGNNKQSQPIVKYDSIVTLFFALCCSCHWRIVAPLKSIIRLKVLDFWTERNLSNCHGHLMVYEGFRLTKELTGERKLTLMGGTYPRYCWGSEAVQVRSVCRRESIDRKLKPLKPLWIEGSLVPGLSYARLSK
uniref:Ovochymase 1 n=1 Tax=Accipiter nisus TaxID=211598 RepID=A0A8B9MWU8_9AVES